VNDPDIANEIKLDLEESTHAPVEEDGPSPDKEDGAGEDVPAHEDTEGALSNEDDLGDNKAPSGNGGEGSQDIGDSGYDGDVEESAEYHESYEDGGEDVEDGEDGEVSFENNDEEGEDDYDEDDPEEEDVLPGKFSQFIHLLYFTNFSFLLQLKIKNNVFYFYGNVSTIYS
jgi:hypothetical protein